MIMDGCAHQYRSVAVIFKVVWLVFLVAVSPAGTLGAEDCDGPVAEPPAASCWDRYHAFLCSSFNEPAIWFDNFFGDPRIDEKEQPSSFLRLRTAARFTEGEGLRFPVRVYANIKLPKASRRLRLVITGENENEADAAKRDSSAISTLESQRADLSPNVGLRYMIYHALRTTLHFGGGMRVQWPLDYYLRARYERLLHVGSKSIIRFSETGYWQSLNGFGETTRFDFEHTLTDSLSNRFSVHGTYSEISSGVEWGVEESLFKQLSTKNAVTLDLGVYGRTRPSTEVTGYNVGVRYRQNILRPWLFFEVEPEVYFPLRDDGSFGAVGAITFFLEIQFRDMEVR